MWFLLLRVFKLTLNFHAFRVRLGNMGLTPPNISNPVGAVKYYHNYYDIELVKWLILFSRALNKRRIF